MKENNYKLFIGQIEGKKFLNEEAQRSQHPSLQKGRSVVKRAFTKVKA